MTTLFKPKYKTISEGNTLPALGVITALKYDDNVFPGWHLNQPVYTGDLVVYKMHYYSIVGQKKNIIKIR